MSYIGFIGLLLRLVVKSVCLLENHADVVQARDEAAAIDLLAAAGAVAETDDVGAVLNQPGRERQPLAVVNQRDLPGLAVGIVAHEDGELAAAFQASGTVADELAVSP